MIEYFNFYQFILIGFVAITHIVGFFIFLLSMPDVGQTGFGIKIFSIWCIYIVLSIGIYFYLGAL